MERTLKASANVHPSSNLTKGENTVCVKGLKYFTATHNPLETTEPQAQAHVGVSGKQSFFSSLLWQTKPFVIAGVYMSKSWTGDNMCLPSGDCSVAYVNIMASE